MAIDRYAFEALFVLGIMKISKINFHKNISYMVFLLSGTKCHIVVDQYTLNTNQSLNRPIQKNVELLPKVYQVFKNQIICAFENLIFLLLES